jgi:hypothetical protein
MRWALSHFIDKLPVDEFDTLPTEHVGIEHLLNVIARESFWVFVAHLSEIDNRGERDRVETGPAYQRSVDFFFSHQRLDVVGLDAAPI